MVIDDLDVWVLAGQSNMQGSGPLDGALPPDPRVWCFSSGGVWAVAEEPLHRFWESYTPVHQALLRPGVPELKRAWSDAALAEEAAGTRTHGAGLGLAFGQAMATATGRPIGLIPAAHGGTTLAQWSPDGKAQGGASLYGAMLDRVHRAGGCLKGILWFQGESDTGGPEVANSYGERMAAWIAAVRADLQRPELPVLMVQIARRAMGSLNTPALDAGWDAVRDAHAALPDRVPLTVAVGAIDLGLSDTVHLHTAAQIRLGRRMATVALRLNTLPGQQCSPRMHRIEAVANPIPGLGELRLHCTGVRGDWQPRHHMAGFGMYHADGTVHQGCWVIDASRDPDDGTVIRLVLNCPPDASTWLGYGRGADPYCNVIDAADLPLLTGRLPCLG